MAPVTVLDQGLLAVPIRNWSENQKQNVPMTKWSGGRLLLLVTKQGWGRQGLMSWSQVVSEIWCFQRVFPETKFKCHELFLINWSICGRTLKSHFYWLLFFVWKKMGFLTSFPCIWENKVDKEETSKVPPSTFSHADMKHMKVTPKSRHNFF